MNITTTRTALIIDLLQDKHDMEQCGSYGEPGYDDPEAGILFADWNRVGDKIHRYLEAAGFALEWSDEWMVAYPHDKAYRTQPDSYSWVCSVLYTDGGDPLTPDDDASEWIEELAITDQAQPIRALPYHISEDDLKAEGYTFAEAGQSGFYNRDDDPATIAAGLWNDIPDLDSVVFQVAESGQFYVNFNVWVKVAD